MPYTRTVTRLQGISLAANWTSAAAALEGVLGYLGQPLPRHAVMGLTGHAWHFCLGTRAGVTALPSGPVDLDWDAMVGRYSRTGFRWERFTGRVDGNPGPNASLRDEAIAWATRAIDSGRPVIGWDFHLHEHAIIDGYSREEGGFFVQDVLSEDLGPFVRWSTWPSLGVIDLFAPGAPFEPDGEELVTGSIETALECFDGHDGPDDGQPRGTAGLEAWAAALDGETEVDRSGNAYTLAVLMAARTDGAHFLADLATSIPELAQPLGEAEAAIREQVKALAPLVTLFPFPTGGHGNVNVPGLRRAAAMALRRAAGHERAAGKALQAALEALR